LRTVLFALASVGEYDRAHALGLALTALASPPPPDQHDRGALATVSPPHDYPGIAQFEHDTPDDPHLLECLNRLLPAVLADGRVTLA